MAWILCDSNPIGLSISIWFLHIYKNAMKFTIKTNARIQKMAIFLLVYNISWATFRISDGLMSILVRMSFTVFRMFDEIV